MKRLLIIAALAALVAAYFFFGLGDYLTVEGIKQVAGDVGAYYERNPAQVIAGFSLVYVAVAAASSGRPPTGETPGQRRDVAAA